MKSPGEGITEDRLSRVRGFLTCFQTKDHYNAIFNKYADLAAFPDHLSDMGVSQEESKLQLAKFFEQSNAYLSLVTLSSPSGSIQYGSLSHDSM